MTSQVTSLRVRLLAGRLNTGERMIGLTGRLAYALYELILAGARGCTPISTPAPRWSSYVHRLRGLGFDIATHHVPNGGDFPGCHAKYILQSEIEIIPEREVAA